MKIKNCEKCTFYQRKTWSKVHRPRNFHAIGMTFAYGYCKKHEMRCADIRNCKQEVNNK